MDEPRAHAALVEEADLHLIVVEVLDGEHLDREPLAVVRRLGLVDGSHPAGADEALQRVLLGEKRPNEIARGGGGGSHAVMVPRLDFAGIKDRRSSTTSSRPACSADPAAGPEGCTLQTLRRAAGCTLASSRSRT